jgi:uncharacterized protein involved in exopolysaccharide biosynthesis
MTASTGQDHSDDSTDPSPPGDGAPGEGVARYGDGAAPREDEVSLLDILLVLARNKALIIQTVLVFALLGFTYAVVAPEKYTSSATVVRESQQGGGSLPGGISAGALSGLGINLGSASSGLTPSAFPDVLQSREVRLSVVRDTFQFPNVDRPMAFVEYANRTPSTFDLVLKYTLQLPWTLKSALGSAISGSSVPPRTTETSASVATREEEDTAIKMVDGMLSTTIDQGTGLMSISATAGGADLSSELTKSFVEHLKMRVREIQTKKVRARVEFVEKRLREAEKELESAESRLAKFLERNQNPSAAPLRFQRNQLRRQVNFKEQLYSDLQSQLTQARLDLQRQQPVVTVVEQAVPPMQRSSPNRTIILLLSLFLGGVIGVTAAFLKSYVENTSEGSNQGKKLKRIQEALKVDA